MAEQKDCTHRYLTAHGRGWECADCGVGILSLFMPIPLPTIAKALEVIAPGVKACGKCGRSPQACVCGSARHEASDGVTKACENTEKCKALGECVKSALAGERPPRAPGSCGVPGTYKDVTEGGA